MKWIEAHGIATFDGDGPQRRAVSLVGTVADITERKSAEESLQRSEARWNAAIEHLGEGAIIATEAGQVIYWNPAARAMHVLRHLFTGRRASIPTAARVKRGISSWS